MKSLDEARSVINEIDREFARLFEKRMQAVRDVAAYKQAHGLQIFDPAREDAVIRKNSALIEEEELRSYFVQFLNANMNISKAFQSRLLEGMRVAYSGTEGAFAKLAARKIFPEANLVAFSSFSKAYEAVENGDCDCAVLPIENSLGGEVGKVLDLSFFGSLFVNGVYEIEVVHHLLALPGADPDKIKTVISHPQALSQCDVYLTQKGYTLQEAENTALAAKYVAERGDPTLAAVASEEAALAFGLQKLESHINDKGSNTTRFAVFSRTRKNVDPRDQRFFMLFTVKNEAGSLAKAISEIGEAGFNLRALKSRPTKDLNWEYYFFLEGEGTLSSPAGESMMKALQSTCRDLKILGSFEKDVLL